MDMNNTPPLPKTKTGKTQTSTLGFVDSLNYETGKNRAPRPERRIPDSQHQHRSSSSSKPRKRKLSAMQEPNLPEKKIIMQTDEVDDGNSPDNSNTSPKKPTSTVLTDPFTKALHEMEARLTKNMKEMIDG